MDAARGHFRLLERAGLVVVDHREYLSGRVQKLETELFIGFLGRALAALALLGELREALLQAALDGGFPVCVRSYASTSRRRRVDGVEATSCAVDAAARESICDHGRRKTRHSSMSISPEPSSSSTSNAFLRRGGWRRNCKFSSPQVLRNVMTSCAWKEGGDDWADRRVPASLAS